MPEPSSRPLFYDFESAARRFAEPREGFSNLAVAENVLLFATLRDRFAQLPALKVPDIMYADAWGTPALRKSVAAMLNRTLPLAEPKSLGPDQISGFSSTRAALAHAIAPLVAQDKNPTFLVPTPCWHGFTWVLEDYFRQRGDSGTGKIIPIVRRPVAYPLTLDMIKIAYEQARPKPLALVLTNPDNPLGNNLDPVLLKSIVSWVLEATEMQLVSDEIYLHSQSAKATPPFVSMLALDVPEKHWKRVHVVWGFAKDFGLSGFRIGVYINRDVEQHQAPRATAQWSPFDTWNSHALSAVIGEEGASGYELMKSTYAGALNHAWISAGDALRQQRLPHFPGSDAALFFWLDLRRWLREGAIDARGLSDDELAVADLEDTSGEAELRHYLQTRAQVDLAPGLQLQPSVPKPLQVPGFFRLCYTAQDPHDVVKAIERIGAALRERGRTLGDVDPALAK